MSGGPSETLATVEDVARRLLAEEEVAAVVTTCQRVRSFSFAVTDRFVLGRTKSFA